VAEDFQSARHTRRRNVYGAIMEAMRESWTDDQMDDLNAKVDRIDADVRGLRVEMKTEFTAVRGEIREGFEKIEKRFEKIDKRFEKTDERFEQRFEKMDARFENTDERFEKRFEKIDARFESMDVRLHQIYQTMLGFCSVALAALIGLIATQI
jgi:flagellar capping protein FliD